MFFTDLELTDALASLRNQPMLKPRLLRGKACDDCAVVCNFYSLYSEALRLADQDEQIMLSKQWFCHQTPRLACKGNANNLGIKW
jgi:hypothetical protein